MYQLPANRTKVLPWLCVLSDWFNQITPSLINEAFTKGIPSIWIVWKSMSRCVTILTKLELKFKKYFLVSKFSLEITLGTNSWYASYKCYSNPQTLIGATLKINWDVLTDIHICECAKIRILVNLDKLYLLFIYYQSIQISFISYFLIN